MAKLLLNKLLKNDSNLRITQTAFTGGDGSHSHSNCIDVAKSGSNGYVFYAPCKLTLKAITFSNAGNTMIYQSNQSMEFADGTTSYFCIGLSHMDTGNSLLSKPIGSTFEEGSVIYYEGTNADGGNNKTDRHCHIRIGKGTFIAGSGSGNEAKTGLYLIGKYSGINQYDLNTTSGAMLMSDAFFSDGMSFTYSNSEYPYLVYPKHRYVWKTTTGALSSGSSSGIGNVYMYPKAVSNGKFYVRKAPNSTGTILYTANHSYNEFAKIRSFLPRKASDGYQWALVVINGYHGYAQVDLKNWNTLQMNGTTDIRLHAVQSTFTKRPMTNATTVNKSGAGTAVTVPNDAKIYGFLPPQSTDSYYQWATTESASSSYPWGRASQLDTLNCYIIDGPLHIDNTMKKL